jgi:hypothetical protein
MFGFFFCSKVNGQDERQQPNFANRFPGISGTLHQPLAVVEWLQLKGIKSAFFGSKICDDVSL